MQYYGRLIVSIRVASSRRIINSKISETPIKGISLAGAVQQLVGTNEALVNVRAAVLKCILAMQTHQS
jgi:hypothetical protein